MKTEGYSSRKFLFTVFVFIVFTVLLLLGHLDQASYVTLVQFALGGYLAANVGERWVAKKEPTQ